MNSNLLVPPRRRLSIDQRVSASASREFTQKPTSGKLDALPIIPTKITTSEDTLSHIRPIVTNGFIFHLFEFSKIKFNSLSRGVQNMQNANEISSCLSTN